MKFLPQVYEFPPGYKAIELAFNPGKDVMFAYGGRIFNPHRLRIPVELFAHEAVHCERQGDDPDGWWAEYIADVAFRAYEELLAHRAEYQCYVRRHANRDKRRNYLYRCAGRLAGDLYGNIFTMSQAIHLIGAWEDPGDIHIRLPLAADAHPERWVGSRGL